MVKCPEQFGANPTPNKQTQKKQKQRVQSALLTKFSKFQSISKLQLRKFVNSISQISAASGFVHFSSRIATQCQEPRYSAVASTCNLRSFAAGSKRCWLVPFELSQNKPPRTPFLAYVGGASHTSPWLVVDPAFLFFAHLLSLWAWLQSARLGLIQPNQAKAEQGQKNKKQTTFALVLWCGAHQHHTSGPSPFFSSSIFFACVSLSGCVAELCHSHACNPVQAPKVTQRQPLAHCPGRIRSALNTKGWSPKPMPRQKHRPLFIFFLSPAHTPSLHPQFCSLSFSLSPPFCFSSHPQGTPQKNQRGRKSKQASKGKLTTGVLVQLHQPP